MLPFTDLAIRGPEKALLTAEEVASVLGLTVGQFEALVKSGEFPAGNKLIHKARPLWPALDVACFVYLKSRRYYADNGGGGNSNNNNSSPSPSASQQQQDD